MLKYSGFGISSGVYYVIIPMVCFYEDKFTDLKALGWKYA